MKNEPVDFTEKDSLETMSQMLEKVKDNHYENGSVPILWGITIAVCGLVQAVRYFWKIDIGFNIYNIYWITVPAALIQFWIEKKAKKRQKVMTHEEYSIKIIWLLYFAAIMGMVMYYKIVLKESYYTQSPLSLQLLLFFIPTLFTGIIARFKPIITGGIICFVLYVISLFTNNGTDALFIAFAAIVSWLLPGLILRKRYYSHRNKSNA